jgi:hypothetical protein
VASGGPQVAGVPAKAREGPKTAPVQRCSATVQIQMIVKLAEVTGALQIEQFSQKANLPGRQRRPSSVAACS